MNTTPSRYISFHFGNKKVFKKCIFDVNAMGKIEQLFRLFFSFFCHVVHIFKL